MKSEQSRFEVHSRRSMLARSVAVGALVTLPGLACGSSDQDTFSQASEVTVAAADTTAPSTDGSTTDPVVDTEPTSTPSGAAFPDGAEMSVDFTFASEGGFGPTRNPYIAVWVEDSAGNLVKTVALWVEQSPKAEKYIHEMRSWYDLTGGDVSMSSATRVAGDYSVVWDGTDDAGNVVSQGDYTVYVEAAREHGPYELVGQDVSIGAEGFTLTPDPQGELTAVSITYAV